MSAAEAAPPRFARLLAVLAPGDAEDVLAAAADLAGRHGAHLDALSVVAPPADLAAVARAAGLAPEALVGRLVAERRAHLEAAVQRAAPAAALHVVAGREFVEIVRHVLAHGSDLVIKTAERLAGLEGRLFASTDQHLLRKCPCPVWLRAAGARPRPQTVVAAVDVDDWDASEPETLAALNRRVVETALRLAADGAARVHVLHAWDAPGEGMIRAFAAGPDARAAARSYVAETEAARRRALDALLRPYRDRAGDAPLAPRLARGPARRVIAEEARALAADVVVLGTVARTGLGGIIIGNTAEDILNSVACSVLAVKPADFRSPLAPIVGGAAPS